MVRLTNPKTTRFQSFLGHLIPYNPDWYMPEIYDFLGLEWTCEPSSESIWPPIASSYTSSGLKTLYSSLHQVLADLELVPVVWRVSQNGDPRWRWACILTCIGLQLLVLSTDQMSFRCTECLWRSLGVLVLFGFLDRAICSLLWVQATNTNLFTGEVHVIWLK